MRWPDRQRAYRRLRQEILLSGLKVELPAPAPWQTPQSVHREDGGEDTQDADQEERIDEEEVSRGVRHTARNAKTLPLRVDERNDQRKEAEEEIDDIPRSSFGEHQRSVQPYD